jgi:autotransporter-associated beta strand protein
MGGGKLNAFGFRTAGMIFLCLVSFWANAQHSDVRITSAASNSNGTWAYAQNGTYTFSPTADNAILSATDLQNKLAAYASVEIKTARTGGTQSGNVTFEAAVTQLNCYYYVNTSTFRITSGGEVQFNANLRLRTTSVYLPCNVILNSGSHVRLNSVIDISGGSAGFQTQTYPSASMTMVIGGDLLVGASGQVLTKGWENITPSNDGYNGGIGGAQTYTVSGSVSLSAGSILNATGGNSILTYQTTAGTGGAITINAVNSVLMRGSVLSNGGYGGRGGNGGAISITSSTSTLDYSGVLSSEGGNDFGGPVGGNGGNITLSGSTGLSIRNNVNAGLGRGSSYTGGGIVTLSTGNTTRTTGGGVNDGMVGSSIIRGSNFIKSGDGVLSLGEVNAYTGTTNLNGGKLYLAVAGAIPSSTALTSSTGTEIDMVGNSLTLASLDGGAKITNSVGGSVTLTVGSNNSSTSHSGVIEDGAGVLSFVKVGTGKLAITGANSYTGPTNITAGILSVGNSTGLGSVQSGTTVNSNSILEFFGGINVGAEALSLTGTGISSQRGALYNLSGVNSFAGEITVTSGVRITGFNGTLNLTAANVITGTNANLLFGGYGILNITGIINIGTGGITYDGGGSLYLMTDNVYSGLTQVTGRNGTLRAGSNGALGSNSSGIVVADQAALELTGGIAILGKSLTVSGLGVGGSGGSIRNVSGDNVWSGTITMAGTLGIGLGSISGKLSLTGTPAIAASSYGLKVYGSPGGVVELVGEALYTGQTELIGGSLLLGNNERIPDVSSLKLSGGDLSTGGYTETLAELNLNTLSSISLGNSVHTLRFSGLSGLFDFHYLTINGWQGTYASPGSTGSAGRIYVGANAVLSPDRLGQMFFYHSGTAVQYNTLQLTDGELVPGSLKFTGATGHSDVRITSAATSSNGTWTLTQGGVYRFNPTADNAVLSATDLQNKLGAYSFVEVSTVRVGGTQSGNMVFESPVTNLNCLTNGSNTSSLRITSGGVVQFYANMTIRSSQQYYPYSLILNAGSIVRLNSVIDLSGSMASFASNTNPTGSVTMVVGGDLVVAGTGQVLTRGWENSQPSNAGFNGGYGGAQTYTVSGSVSLAAGSVLDASGGNSIRTFQTTAGTGGSISISAVNAILMRGSVVSNGGYGGWGGTGGAISISSSSSNLDYSGVLSSEGGNDYGGIVGGNGGNISLSAPGGLSIRNNVNAGLGRGTSYVGGGNVTLTTSNTTLTSGGGVNDGLVGGSIIRAYHFTKSGAGVLNLSGANTYTGSTTVNAGKLVLNVEQAIPSTSDVTLAANTILDLNGFSNTVASITGVSSTKITNSSSNASTFKFGTNSSTYDGLIEDGVGVVHLEKVGTGTTTLATTANTYTGLTRISGGNLAISHASSLGSTNAGTIADGGGLHLNGVTVSGEALTLGSLPTLGVLYASTGTNVWNGTLNLSAASSIYVHLSSSLSINPPTGPAIQGTNTNLTCNVYGTLNINGEIATGNATLTKNYTGILNLNTANSYTGLTTLASGQTIAKNDLALGSNSAGTVISSGANLTLDGALNISGETLTITSNAITANGALLTKNGASTWSGNISLAGTAVNWNTESDLTVTGAITNGSTLWTVGRTTGSTGNLIVNGIISGTGGLDKTGTGQMTLNAVNTYTGLTRITAGRLVLGGNQVISNASNVYFNGGTLSTEGYSETLGQLFLSDNSTLQLGAGAHTINFASAGTFTTGKTLTVNGWDGVYSIAGSGSSPSLDNSGMLKTTSTKFISSNGVLRSAGAINQYGQIRVSGQSGTSGNFFVGSPLSASALNQIKFFNATANTTHFSVQLGTNEVVPDFTR